jgi:hypothetical protein
MICTSKLKRDTIVKAIIFGSVFSCYVYYGQNSIDLNNYREAYEKLWFQFEPAFNLYMRYSIALGLPFEVFWLSLGIIISALFTVIFGKHDIIIFAIPNIIYLISNSFSVQLRYAIACLFVLTVVQISTKQKWVIFLSPLIHIFSLVTVSFYVFIANMRSLNLRIYNIKNLIIITLFLCTTTLLMLILDFFVIGLGYAHYLDSKFFTPKSFSSILYMCIHLTVILILLSHSFRDTSDRKIVLIGFFVLLFSLIFMNFAIISGRALVFYFLIEPFVIKFAYSHTRKNYSGWAFISLLYVSCFAKFFG